MFVMKRKTLVMVSLIVLLVVTGYLNYQYNLSQTKKNNDTTTAQSQSGDIKVTDTTTPSDDKSSIETAGNFFLDFRAERDKTRNQEIELLDSIINNKDTDKDTLKDAQQQKLEITQAMEKEVTIEGLVKAKGISDVVVTLHKGSVNVIVDEPELTEAQVAQILDIVTRETDEKAENIKIIPAN